ncbi:GTP-binding protein [candidate division KSB1 bacterium]|nr:GTP-binding protein [candidate division KSB1 bacterium]
MLKPVIVSKKLCMLGSYGVGKSSLVRRFVYNKFDDKYLSTIGVQISQKILAPFEDSKKRNIQLKLILWDLAHIEKFNNIIKNYFRGTHGAIIVLDLTRPQTIEEIPIYLEPFLEQNPNASLAFVGNKKDLVDPDDPFTSQIEKIAKKYHAPHILTSAKTGEGVEQLFVNLGRQLVEG